MKSRLRRITRVFSGNLYAPFLGLGIAIGALLLILSFSFYHAIARQEALVARLAAQQGGTLVSTIEASLHTGMRMAWQRKTLEALLEELGREKGVEFLAVLNQKGKIFAHSQHEGIGKISNELAQLARSSHASPELIQESGSGDVIFYARRLRSRPRGPDGQTGQKPMGLAMGMRPPSGNLFQDAEKLTAVAGIRAEQYDALRQQARYQTLLIALVVVLLTAGAVYVGFVVQGYQLAHSNLRRMEQIKNVLNKFVPSAVLQLLEQEPSAALEKTEQDVTVLFLDIAGYTTLSETMRREELNALVERYFARFLDNVHRHGGDVTETAGDGLMVLFRDKRSSDHPRSAARAALGIRLAAQEMNTENSLKLPPLEVNMGINSGPCLVGSTKIQGTTAERWTFTATGLVTNVAARLCAQAIGGEILLGPESATRLGNEFSLETLGERQFKNVAAPVPVFRLPKEMGGPLPPSSPATP